ncbi:MAG: signal recognition particle protein [Desulfovibrionaceae bacterium]|nr:signal recognition particle protein [Desulfovibrionaceae bacterium]
MFDHLTDRLRGVFRNLGGQARLDERNVQEGLREVRLALLEADVNFRVVKDFTEAVRQRCMGLELGRNITPTQRFVQVVHEELTAILGGETQDLRLEGLPPHVIMLVGLQGSGKTTSAAKLAHWLRERRHKPYLVSADVYRPAAIEQLAVLAGQLGMPCFPPAPEMRPEDIAARAMQAAKEAGCDVLLLDTAGRLHIDQPLMDELAVIKARVRPEEILLAADAMTGQEAVNVAEAFDQRLGLTGVILTKMDGDARGGAALSIKSVTGKSVKFVGMGERIPELETFHPERVAGRILGMGDMLTLLEKTQGAIQAEEAEELAAKFRREAFDLEDFRANLRRIKKLGSLEGIMKLIPGLGGLGRKLEDASMPEKEMVVMEAVINSMTPEERSNPKILNGSRKLRVAKGSGVSVARVNQLLKQFEGMRGMMREVMGGKKGGLGKIRQSLGRLPGIGGLSGLAGLSGVPGAEGRGQAPGPSRSAAKKKKKLRKAARRRCKK